MRFRVKHEALPTAVNTERTAIMTVASQHTDRITKARRDAAKWVRRQGDESTRSTDQMNVLRVLAASVNEQWESNWTTEDLATATGLTEDAVKHHLDLLGEQHAVYRFAINPDGQPAGVPFTLNRFYPQRANVWGCEPWLWR